MSSGNLSERDRQILLHLTRYRLAFKEVLSVLFFEGRDPQKVLDRLRQDEYVAVTKGVAKNRSTYCPLRKAVHAIGSKSRRADTLGPEALSAHLAVYGFCFLLGRPRIRLEISELRTMFDHTPPRGRFHCLERSSKATCLYHVYVPGPSTKPADVTARTRQHVAEVSKSPEIRRWLKYGAYSHAIIVDVPTRAEAIETALRGTTSADDRHSVYEAGNCCVAHVPGPMNLEEALRSVA